jgi:hypothetical protein
MRVFRPLMVAPVVALAVAGALAGTAAASTVRGSNGPFSATLVAGTHSPKANVYWPISLTATQSGRAARCGITYQFLFGGQVVSTQIPRYKNGRPHTSFTGHFTDQLTFPARSEGYPLTVRVHVWSGSRAVNLDYAVKVVKRTGYCRRRATGGSSANGSVTGGSSKDSCVASSRVTARGDARRGGRSGDGGSG